MRYFYLSVFAWSLCINIYAQKNQWTVKTGESIERTLGDSNIYRYSQFTQGAVYFRDGNISHAPLNFNFVNGKMQFTNSSGDTLDIINEATIKYITIQTDTFYFDKFYIELIYDNTTVKLGKLVAIIQTDFRKEGAYGQMSSASGISTMSSLYIGNQSYKLTEKSEITLQKKTMYFIGDNFNHFLFANKKNINRMFNTKASAIEPFIKESKTSFANEADLKKLVDFISKI